MKSMFIILAFVGFSYQSLGQSLNTEIIKEGQNPYLLGKIDRSGLEGPHYKGWFQKNYSNYQPDPQTIEALKPLLNNYEIKLFMGTWCGDSKREVPRFYKILDALDYPMDQLTVVALDRSADLYKQSPQHEEAGLNIHRVPTFIIHNNGKELNRIVEHPVESLEKDLLSIVSKNNYQSNYAIVSAIDQKLSKGLKKFKKSEDKIIANYRDVVSSMYELNTYAKVLMHSNRSDEAIAVLEMNTRLFPEDANTYLSLSNNLLRLDRKAEGLIALEKAAALAPDNTSIQKQLDQLKSK